MKTYNFITQKEYNDIKRDYEKRTGNLMNGEKEIETLLSAFPDAKDGAEEFFYFLHTEDENRKKYEKEHPSRVYLMKVAPFPEDVVDFRTSSVLLICLERHIGKILFDEYKWNSPEIQEAYTKSKVAGADYYKQFESNPNLAVDVLDNLRDRTCYGAESKKIEGGVIHGKYEN